MAPDLNESNIVSLWKSMSSSSPDANPWTSLSEPTSVEARSATSDIRGGFEVLEPKYDGIGDEERPADDKAVDVVLVCSTGEQGLLPGADDDDEDNPSRARSTLKLESRDNGGRGEELFRFRD